MANFDAQVCESQSQVAEGQTKIAELTGRIETAREKLKCGDDAMINIENASLGDMHAHNDVMNANIAELIACAKSGCALPRSTTSCRI